MMFWVIASPWVTLAYSNHGKKTNIKTWLGISPFDIGGNKMKFRYLSALTAVLVVTSVILAGCAQAAPEPTPEPTTDMNALSTQIAATVVQQITLEAALQPSSTATVMRIPTNTPIPTEQTAAGGTTGITKTATVKVAVAGGGKPAPTKTPRSYTDQAKLVKESIGYGQVMKPGQDFDASWTFKNVGKSTWNSEYYAKYIDGDLVPRNTTFIRFDDGTEVGDTQSFTVDMTAPQEPGIYVSNWALYTEDDTIFYKFFVAIEVRE